MDRLLRSARAREDGFVVVVVVLVLLVATLASVAAFAAVDGDLPLSRHNDDAKRAYAAAEAGIDVYLEDLAQDNDAWSKCETISGPVNLAGTVTKWATMPVDPNAPNDPLAKYAIELVPANGKPQCVAGDATTMIDSGTGTFTIRVTGKAGPAAKPVYRSAIATFRRKSFLDYAYANNFETQDPVLVHAENPSTPTAWLASSAGCAAFRRDGRDTHVNPTSGYQCSTINYAGTDAVNGPFHTNDGVNIRSPENGSETTFGRPGHTDLVEYWDWTNAAGSSPPQTGTSRVLTGTNYQQLPLPTSNAALAQTALPAYRYTGATKFKLHGAQMDVCTGTCMTAAGPWTMNVDLPTNGVISVGGAGCGDHDPTRPNDASAAALTCGDAFVEGNYGKNLTITTSRDIVVTNNLYMQSGTNTLLGLVATGFVRVQRKVASYAPCDSNTVDQTAAQTPVLTAGNARDRTIQAAILSLNHVFTIDSYNCGDDDGTVHVFGSIAQVFRGRTAGCNPGDACRTGYSKDYAYDDRLGYRSPPYFLAPVESTWKITRQLELTTPAASRT